MNKKLSLGAAILLICVIAAATYAAGVIHAMARFNKNSYDITTREQMYDKLSEINKLIYDHYTGTVNNTQLMDAIAQGYLTGTGDPNAQYYDVATYANMLDTSSGKVVQIGIETQMGDDGYILVTEVYPESPASARGIEVGDFITKVDELDVTKENYNEAKEMLRGDPGATVQLELLRNNTQLSMEVSRRAVEVPSLTASILPETKIGLVKFKEFNKSTPDQFDNQMRSLVDQGAVGVIFDVRGVTNSTLDSVGAVLDAILPEGTLVSSTDKNGEQVILKTSDNARQIQIPITILVDESTAGEAELFAQVIKDYNRGSIIGAKSKGRGSLQTVYNLSDGSAVKFTTAVYIPPNGQPYDGEGVKPDYEVRMTEEQIALLVIDPIKNDLQLQKALEIVSAAVRSTGVADPTSSVVDVVSSEASSATSSDEEDENSENDEDSQMASSDELSSAVQSSDT